MKIEFELRPILYSDLDALVKYADDPGVAGNLTDRFPSPYTREAGKMFIKYAQSDGPEHIMAVSVKGEFSGAIGIHPMGDIFAKNAELGYWLARHYWGKGIMTAAIIQMVKYGFQNIEIDRIFARPFGRNIASQKALEKAGFILEARFEKTIYKNGQYEDELVYAIRR